MISFLIVHFLWCLFGSNKIWEFISWVSLHGACMVFLMPAFA